MAKQKKFKKVRGEIEPDMAAYLHGVFMGLMLTSILSFTTSSSSISFFIIILMLIVGYFIARKESYYVEVKE